MKATPDLRIGWEIDGKGNVKQQKKPGGKSRTAGMLLVAPKQMERHTLIIGQSGSGKSFFVGRLIEEIMLRTKARCVVVDPNGDYCQIIELAKDVDPWDWPSFYSEDSRPTFQKEWSKVAVFVKSAKKDASKERIPGQPSNHKNPKFYWHDVPAELLSSIVVPGEDVALHRGIRNIHELVRQVGSACLRSGTVIPDVSHWVKDALLKKKWPAPCTTKDELPNIAVWKKILANSDRDWKVYLRFADQCTTQPELPFRATTDPQFAGTPEADEPMRLDVLDITSVEDSEIRALATGTLLLHEWTRSRKLWGDAASKKSKADRFLPTFLVLEEAHYLMPRDSPSPSATALRDQIRTIAAEGRKYGLFLVISSQRPDKLDAQIVSECQNSALLRISGPVVRPVAQMTGIDENEVSKCVGIQQGVGFLFGPWAKPNANGFKSAARRTREGGTNLSNTWRSSRNPD